MDFGIDPDVNLSSRLDSKWILALTLMNERLLDIIVGIIVTVVVYAGLFCAFWLAWVGLLLMIDLIS